MNRTERYLKRATLGLWGRRRREAQMELRGAIEDKLWRFQHLGLTQGEAERRALAELGPARAVAGGLSRVHSVPVGVQGALLLGLMGVLGVQVVASAVGVRATMWEPSSNFCNLSEAYLKTQSVRDQQEAQRYIKKFGRAEAEVRCRELAPGLFNYLKIDDVLAAFKSNGVGVKSTGTEKSPYTYLLKFPGELFPININLGKFNGSIVQSGGAYVETSNLIGVIKDNFSFPIRFDGIKNPILRIDNVAFQLGTTETPVRGANILAPVLVQQLLADRIEQFQQFVGKDTDAYYARIAPSNENGAKRGASLKVDSPENTLYATLLSQYQRACKTCGDFYELAVRPVQSGQLWLGSGLEPTRLVGSFADLQKAHTGKAQVALLLKITSGGDLRNVKYQIVPPTQAQLVPAKP